MGCVISIAMCTYNGEKYLLEQLESIKSQTLLPYELVICDDGSNDKTIELVRSFAINSSFSVQVHVNEENFGSTKNFEKAIKLCKGSIIVLADQDDVWYPDKLETIEKVFNDKPQVGMVFSDAEMVDEKLYPLGFQLWETVKFSRFQKMLVRKGAAIDVLLKHEVVTGATMAFRAKLVDYAMPIDKSWIHDGWLALFFSALSKVEIIEKPLIKYRQHSRQQVGAKSHRFMESIKISKECESSFYRDKYYQYNKAYEKFIDGKNCIFNQKLANKIKAKLLHLCVRQNMPESKLLRLIIVLKECLLLRYSRFANGWRSAAKDLVLRD